MKNSGKTQIAVNIFDQKAELYQDKYMDVSLYHDSFDTFCERIKPRGANVLELACGPGNITQYLLQKRQDFHLLATDLAPNMLALAKLNNPGAEFQLLDAKKISELGQKFDAIMCGFCLPYLSKEEAIKLIEDASQILTEQGVLYLSTMEDDYSASAWKGQSSGEREKIYMYYHQEDYLAAALRKFSFSKIAVQRKTYATPDGSSTVDLILIAQK